MQTTLKDFVGAIPAATARGLLVVVLGILLWQAKGFYDRASAVVDDYPHHTKTATEALESTSRAIGGLTERLEDARDRLISVEAQVHMMRSSAAEPGVPLDPFEALQRQIVALAHSMNSVAAEVKKAQGRTGG